MNCFLLKSASGGINIIIHYACSHPSQENNVKFKVATVRASFVLNVQLVTDELHAPPSAHGILGVCLGARILNYVADISLCC